MTNSLINWVLEYPKRFILCILLITLAAGCFVYKNISINTSNTDLLSKELTFRKNDIAFTKEFPQFSNNIIVVIDADKSDVVKDIASSFYKEIKKKEGLLFSDVFYPDELDFFKRNGLLYLSEEELENKLDEMTSYQPFISRLSQDQTILGLLKTIDLFLSADLYESDLGKIKVFLNQFTDAGCKTNRLRLDLSPGSPEWCDEGKDEKSLTWSSIFSKGDYSSIYTDFERSRIYDEPLSFVEKRKKFKDTKKYRYIELIYLQPKLNFEDFFPSKESLIFLENYINKTLKEYKRSGDVIYKTYPSERNFNIRLTGTVPMEHDELSDLEKDSKIGVTISLILVFVLLSTVFWFHKYLLLGSILTLLIGLIWTTAFGLLFFKELNLISVAFAILFIGLAIDFAIHYGLRVFEIFVEEFDFERNKATKKENLFIKTNNSIQRALFLTAIAIAIGFFSFIFTSFTGLAQLGAIAGAGMFVSFFLTIFFLPSFLILIRKPFIKNDYYRATAFNQFIHKSVDYFTGGIFSELNIYRFINENSKKVFFISFFFLLLFFADLNRIEFNNDPLKLRNQMSPSVKTMNQLIDDENVSPYSIDLLVNNISEANKFKEQLSNLDEIKEVNLITDLIPKNQEEQLEVLNQFKTFFSEINLKEPRQLSQDILYEEKAKINELLKSIDDKSKGELKEVTRKLTAIIDLYPDTESFADLEERYFYFFRENIKKFNDSLKATKITEQNIPDSLRSRYIGKNGTIRLEIVPSKNLDNYINKKNFVESVYKINPNIAGGSFTMYEAGKTIIESFKEAMTISICFTILFLFFTLKNYKKVFIVFINLVAALIFALGISTITNLNLNFANIIALPLLFGLGAATSIQTILRTDNFKTLDDYFASSTTPRAIFFSLLTTLGAFFVLSLSSHVGTASMGKLLIISIFSIYLANLTILIPLEKYFFKK